MIAPANEIELADAIASAKDPFRIMGGGTRPVGKPANGQVLSTRAISGVELYEPGALTIVVKAGTPVDEVEAILAKENQRLPFEPMDHRSLLGTDGIPTIGGVAAANVSGPRRIQAGACRDYMLGVRFVDGMGTMVKNGGRVMKNVTGYDLVKLMAGSFGTLGVLSEVSLKVLPDVEKTMTLVADGAGWTVTSKIFATALGSPYEVTGAARLPKGCLVEHGAVLLRLEGFGGSVKYRAQALGDLLEQNAVGVTRVIDDPGENTAIWKSVRDVEPLAGKSGDLWKISVKPSDLLRLSGIGGHEDVVIDWGGGLIWACVPEGTDLRAKNSHLSGHMTLMRGEGRCFHPEPAPVTSLSKNLRLKFDPRGILNPGLMET